MWEQRKSPSREEAGTAKGQRASEDGRSRGAAATGDRGKNVVGWTRREGGDSRGPNAPHDVGGVEPQPRGPLERQGGARRGLRPEVWLGTSTRPGRCASRLSSLLRFQYSQKTEAGKWWRTWMRTPGGGDPRFNQRSGKRFPNGRPRLPTEEAGRPGRKGWTPRGSNARPSHMPILCPLPRATALPRPGLTLELSINPANASSLSAHWAESLSGTS